MSLCTDSVQFLSLIAGNSILRVVARSNGIMLIPCFLNFGQLFQKCEAEQTQSCTQRTKLWPKCTSCLPRNKIIFNVKRRPVVPHAGHPEVSAQLIRNSSADFHWLSPWNRNMKYICGFWGSHSGVDDDSVLLVYKAAAVGSHKSDRDISKECSVLILKGQNV
jgi:hypothetical protein